MNAHFTQALMAQPRARLELLSEAIITILDMMDGDPDREEDDDSGGNVEDGGELVNEDGVGDILSAKPVYGIDQTKGPLNGATAYQRQQLDERLADALKCRDNEMVAQCRKQLARLDAREAEFMRGRAWLIESRPGW
jgi:hypothetical protein